MMHKGIYRVHKGWVTTESLMQEYFIVLWPFLVVDSPRNSNVHHCLLLDTIVCPKLPFILRYYIHFEKRIIQTTFQVHHCLTLGG